MGNALMKVLKIGGEEKELSNDKNKPETSMFGERSVVSFVVIIAA